MSYTYDGSFDFWPIYIYHLLVNCQVWYGNNWQLCIHSEIVAYLSTKEEKVQ